MDFNFNADSRALVLKIKAIIEDETMPEDVNILPDTLKVERIRRLLMEFFSKHNLER